MLEEVAMRLGQRIQKSHLPDLRLRSRTDEPRDLHAIGLKGRRGAIGEPLAETGGIAQEIEHDRLVIALEEMNVKTARQRAKQQLDHAPAVWPAIDIVADEDEGPS